MPLAFYAKAHNYHVWLVSRITLVHVCAKNFGCADENSSSKVGRIRITSGVMNIQQGIKELSWLVPGDHQWEIYSSGINMFKVNYPTKADYERVKKIK
jgi:hypothetical protein